MKTETLWNKLATGWDKPGVSLGKDDIEHTIKTNKFLNPGSNVLDYGCATGSIAFELARTAKTVYGIDISSKMIDIAKRKAQENKTENVTFLHGTIFNEGLKKESFDVITAFSILHLVGDLPLVFKRINQLLKEGGVFISASPCLRIKNVSGLLIGVPVFLASKIGLLPRVNLFSTSGLKDLISKANFQIIENEKTAVSSTTNVFIIARKDGRN